MKKRPKSLWFALIATLLLSAWSTWPKPDDNFIGVRKEARKETSNALKEAALPDNDDPWVVAMRRQTALPAMADLFYSEKPVAQDKVNNNINNKVEKSIPAQQSSMPVSAPVSVPTLPYSYLGKLERDGKVDVYLENSANGNQPLIVHAGQILPGEWRFDGIVAGVLSFTYLPSNENHVLPITVPVPVPVPLTLRADP